MTVCAEAVAAVKRASDAKLRSLMSFILYE
jgi:hypothetical protein